MYLPNGARFIIQRLEKAGKRADVVGGCVRDFLCGKTANDFDITTSATPDEMLFIFKDVKTVETGLKHGTLTVIIDKIPYEVTTYRKDGEYTDNRHPDSVTFTGSLTDDLSRRDFTMNSIAYSENYGYTDVFGGMEDIEKGIVRTVGNAETRFNEDSLRILRAIRFASVLGYRIEENTHKAILSQKSLLLNVSAERIFEEWKKLVGGVDARRIVGDYISVISVFLPEISKLPEITPMFEVLTAEERELYLFCEANSPEELYRAAMQRLKSDSKRIRCGTAVLRDINASTENERDIRLLILRNGFEITESIINIRTALGKTSEKAKEILKHLKSLGIPHRISDMEIGGEDLKELGFSGKKIGEVLSLLLLKIITEELPNEKRALVNFIKTNFCI